MQTAWGTGYSYRNASIGSKRDALLAGDDTENDTDQHTEQHADTNHLPGNERRPACDKGNE